MIDRSFKFPGVYKHFKGHLYYVYGIVKHTETEEYLVAYQSCYKPYTLFVRPVDMFLSKVDFEKYPAVKQKYRFEYKPYLSKLMARCIENISGILQNSRSQ